MARARRRRPQAAAPLPEHPPELRDPAAQVWHDQRAYHRFMAQRGWKMPPAQRMGVATAPSNRRSAAAAGWAVETGVFTTTTYGDGKHPHADWNALRSAGLCD